MQELLYTSAPRGLKPGSRGFCTVLSTQGMVAPVAAALEGLSGYRPVFPIGHARVAENPVVYSHLKLQVAGKSWYVLSRIADYGLDYSQRTNKLAHHLVLDKSELPAVGPASVLRASGLMRKSWEGEPKIVPAKSITKQPPAPTGVCQTWKEMTGDAGWAGVLAESFLKDPNRPVILLFEPGQDLRPLIDESLSLLPAERRWDVTFSTYFTGSSHGITCLWRGIVLGSKEATESLRFVNALRIDLTSTDVGRAEGGDLVEAARAGIRPTARPTLSLKHTASREQQEPRVVFKDDTDEPTVSQAAHEAEDTERYDAAVVNHDHSQAPPRLTRSAFKFAYARRNADADHPGVRTSRRRRFIIPLFAILLFGGLVVLGFTLTQRSPDFVALLRSNKSGSSTKSKEPEKDKNGEGNSVASNANRNDREDASNGGSEKLPEKSDHDGPNASGTDVGANTNASAGSASTSQSDNLQTEGAKADEKGKTSVTGTAKAIVSDSESEKSTLPASTPPSFLDKSIKITLKSGDDPLPLKQKVVTVDAGTANQEVTLRLIPPRPDFPIRGGAPDAGKLPILCTAKVAGSNETKKFAELKLTASSELVFNRTDNHGNEKAAANLSLCLLELSVPGGSPQLVALNSIETANISEKDGIFTVISDRLKYANDANVALSLHDLVIKYRHNKKEHTVPVQTMTTNKAPHNEGRLTIPTSEGEKKIEVVVRLGKPDSQTGQVRLDLVTEPTKADADKELTDKVDELKEQLDELIKRLKEKQKDEEKAKENEKKSNMYEKPVTDLDKIRTGLRKHYRIPNGAIEAAVADPDVRMEYNATKISATVKDCESLLAHKDLIDSLAKAKVLRATMKYEVRMHEGDKTISVDLLKIRGN